MSSTENMLKTALTMLRERLAAICVELAGLPEHPGCRRLNKGVNAYIASFATISADGGNMSVEYRNFPHQYASMAAIIAETCSKPAKTATSLETILSGMPLYGSGRGKQIFHPAAVRHAEPLLREVLMFAKELAPAEPQSLNHQSAVAEESACPSK